MRKNLISVLNYFAQFSYAPSFEEIYLFYPQHIDQKKLRNAIQNESKAGKIVRIPNNTTNGPIQGSGMYKFSAKKAPLYTLPQYSIPVKKKRRDIAENNVIQPAMTIRLYISLLSALPLVRFVGITGASAMNGYTKNDDLDLFVIATHNRLWTTRFIAVVLAKIIGIHGNKGVCLNLFFDEGDLAIPPRKQNIYIAHELLQMKPLVDKSGTYSLLMGANLWILKLFPNALKVLGIRPSNPPAPTHRVIGIIEHTLKHIQLPIIKKNKTGMRITSTQLWLFKADFEKQIKWFISR